MEEKRYPRLMIAGASSSSGKTTVTTGLLKVLTGKGLKVRAYKIGPDYIDTGYLSYVVKDNAYNLDKWLMGRDNIKDTFLERSACRDISIIEGVMGLFDGGDCSTAEMAKLLDCPVILCINASKTGESAAAVVRGFIKYDRRVDIVGIILTMVSGKSHYDLIRDEILKRSMDIEVLGYVEKDRSLEVHERHLGLTTVFEKDLVDDFVKKTAEKISRRLDIDRIIRIARDAPGVSRENSGKDSRSCQYSGKTGNKRQKVRIGYAFDRAFNFFYKQNLELLERSGAECTPFSPLDDDGIDQDTDLLIIWGGFPEVFAPQLSMNRNMIESINSYIDRGGLVYAECGGLMYLASNFISKDSKKYPLLGRIPVDIKMSDRLTGFGYKEAEMLFDTFMGRAGTKVKGHEFHHSYESGIIDDCSRPYRVSRKGMECDGECSRLEGYASGNIFASYLHLHFMGNGILIDNIFESIGKNKSE